MPRGSITRRGDLDDQFGSVVARAVPPAVGGSFYPAQVTVEITPEPSKAERRAILEALGRADAAPALSSRWRASALDDLRDGAFPEQSGRDARVVEP